MIAVDVEHFDVTGFDPDGFAIFQNHF